MCAYDLNSYSIERNRGPSLNVQGGLDYINSVMTKVVKESMEDAY